MRPVKILIISVVLPVSLLFILLSVREGMSVWQNIRQKENLLNIQSQERKLELEEMKKELQKQIKEEEARYLQDSSSEKFLPLVNFVLNKAEEHSIKIRSYSVGWDQKSPRLTIEAQGFPEHLHSFLQVLETYPEYLEVITLESSLRRNLLALHLEIAAASLDAPIAPIELVDNNGAQDVSTSRLRRLFLLSMPSARKSSRPQKKTNVRINTNSEETLSSQYAIIGHFRSAGGKTVYTVKENNTGKIRNLVLGNGESEWLLEQDAHGDLYLNIEQIRYYLGRAEQ